MSDNLVTQYIISGEKKNIYLYDGTFDGMLSAVFDAWNDIYFQDIKSVNEVVEENFTVNIIETVTSEEKAERIIKAAVKIYDRMDFDLFRIFLTSSPCKERIVYRYLKVLFKMKRMTDSARYIDAVDDFMSLLHNYSRETERMYGFVRFKNTDRGIYYSEVYTDHSQLEMLAPFFLNRMPGIKWVMLDVKRRRAVLCDGNSWLIREGVGKEDVTVGNTDEDFDRWWQEYKKAVTIKERLNPKLQQKLMPKKYHVI